MLIHIFHTSSHGFNLVYSLTNTIEQNENCEESASDKNNSSN
jgi:hypothetical protein